MSILAQIEQELKQITNFSDLTNIVKSVYDEIVENLFLTTIQDIDETFFHTGSWKDHYTCNGFVQRTIITPLGEITYNRRYYMNKDKNLHDHFYYVDKMLEIPSRKHLSKEALATLLNMVVDVNGSYAAKHAIQGVVISKQTISNYLKIQNTIAEQVPTVVDEKVDEPLSFDVIYVEADEAHVNLQQETEVDSTNEIKTTPNDKKVCKSKNIIDKLV